MAIVNQNTLIGNKVSTQQFVDAEIKEQTAPDNITAAELNVVLSRILALIEDMIQSTYNTVDKIPINNVYQGSITNTLDVILNNYQLKINPINTAFNKNFGTGGNSEIVPRFDDPRFIDQRVPVNNSVSTIKIQENAITNNKLGTMPTLTIKGNNTGITANPLDLTPAQVRTMLNIEDNAQTNLGASKSITIEDNTYQLVNDVSNPGNLFYYGTDASGVKGFFNLITAINNEVNSLPGDGWGSDIVNIVAEITNSDTSNTFTILQGTGVPSNPLSINTVGIINLIKDIVNNSNGDGWGNDTVQLVSGGGLTGNGTSTTPLSINVRANDSLLGNGTTTSNLQVNENWLTTFIEEYNTNNGGDGWGSQIAETEGFIVGTGVIADKIKLKNGSNTENQLILWDYNLEEYKSVNASAFANEFITLNTTSPIEGNGSIALPLKLEDGTSEGNTWYWQGGLGGVGTWIQINLSDFILGKVTSRNGITEIIANETNVFELGGTLIQDTSIITNGNVFNLTYTNLPGVQQGGANGITNFGYNIGATWEEQLDILGLMHGNVTDYSNAVNPYTYIYTGIEHGDQGAIVSSVNTNDGNGSINQSEIKLEDSKIVLELHNSDPTTNSSINLTSIDGIYINSSNLKGIRYVGFGETNINTEGSNVDYTELEFNSLVPKKYVDDAIGVPYTVTQNIASGETNLFFTHNLDTLTPNVRLYLVDYPSVGRNTLLNNHGISVATFLENLVMSTTDNNNIQFTFNATAACKITLIVTK